MTQQTQYARIVLNDVATYVQIPNDGPIQQLSGPPWEEIVLTGATVPRPLLNEALTKALCPVEPSKIIGIGRNYRKHAEELDNEVPTEPLMFFKPPSSLLASGGTVRLPPESERVDYEAELAVVMGSACRRVTPGQALDFVFGYTLACDVTARDIQKGDHQWTRGKGFDTFCPIGPTLVRSADLKSTKVSLSIDGRNKQSGSTDDMIFNVAALISYASQAMTLEPGDVILTGTPEGVGPLKNGNRVTLTGTGLANLTFDVKSES